MTNYLLDGFFVAGVLLIMITSMMKNQRKLFRNVFCFGLSTVVVVLGVVYFDLLGIGTKVANFIASYNLGRFFVYLPAAFETEAFKTLCGCGVLFGAIIVGYLLLLLVCKIFSGERRKIKRDPTYTVTHKPFLGFLVGLVKSLLFVYIFAVFLSIGRECFTGLNVSDSIIFSLLEKYNLIFADGKIREFSSMLFN